MNAKRYSMKTREIPLDDSWDVIVAGGGPSGCTAAAAAARDGAKTLLIEATGSLGGMGTSGLVPAWCPFTDKEKVIYRGLALRVFEASREGVAHIPPDRFDWVPIDPERLKRVYDDLVTGSGASVLFHTVLTGVVMGEDTKGDVTTLLVANKSGLSALRAKVYVDATGDGDLAAWAGAEFEKGEPGTGDMQPATHCFILANVDYYAYRNGPPWVKGGADDIITRIALSGKYPEIPDRHACNNTIGPGCVGFNAGHLWNVDNTDPASVSKALMDGRKQAAAWHAALAEFHPKAFGGAYLAATGALMGVRETRRIVGDYVLTIDDFLARRSFEDEICRNAYFIDVHHAACNAEANRKGEAEALVNPHHYGKGESHGIPYRCLTPRRLRNVLVAGRCISSDRPVQGSVRVMPVCLCTGEAAGVAAVMAANGSRDVHAVDAAKLRARLREAGAYLP